MTTQNDDTVRNGSASEHSVQPLVSRPIGCPRELWVALTEVREAQRYLKSHEEWNKGRDHATVAADDCLRHAHNALALYIGTIQCD